MIVPTDKLLRWVGMVVVPFALLGALEPSTVLWSVLVISALAVFVLADGWRARSALKGIDLEVPDVVRMSKDRAGSVEVRILKGGQKAKALRLALSLPQEVGSVHEELRIELPAQSEWSRLSWPCVPRQRGAFRLETACVGSSSPFGFWTARKLLPVTCEVRVYPNLLKDRRDLAALFLHRGFQGAHAQRQVGKGRDFEKLRDYIPGDGYDEVHWKATAKRGRPVTKVFQIERTQEIYVIVDASRLSGREVAINTKSGPGEPGLRNPKEGGKRKSEADGFDVREGHGSGQAGSPLAPQTSHLVPVDSWAPGLEARPSILERFVTAALVMGLAAEQQGDLFGLVTFTDKVQRFLRAKNGKVHFSQCRDALYMLHPQMVTPDFEDLFTFIRLRLRRRALLLFLTSLDDAVLAESFVKNMDLIRRQHLVMVNMIEPVGVAQAFSDPSVETEDDLYERLGGHLLWSKLRELEKVLKRRGVRFSVLKNERLTAELVSQYLSVKKRQLL